DFFQEWASGRNWLAGDPVYTSQDLTVPRYLGLRPDLDDPRRIQFNGHPPSSVLLGLPLAALDFGTAFGLWSLVSLAALLLSLWLIVRGLEVPHCAWSLLPLVALLAVCFPFWHHMVHGNVNLVLLLFLTLTWSAARSGRLWLAGAWLGAATAVKLFPGFLILYFLARRQWRVVAG